MTRAEAIDEIRAAYADWCGWHPMTLRNFFSPSQSRIMRLEDAPLEEIVADAQFAREQMALGLPSGVQS